ncbi:hypothetical protein RUND412_006956 [Rhizina undulata]
MLPNYVHSTSFTQSVCFKALLQSTHTLIFNLVFLTHQPSKQQCFQITSTLKVNRDTDLIMAISPQYFDSQGKCFKPAALSRGNKRSYVTVITHCTICVVQNVNLNPATF